MTYVVRLRDLPEPQREQFLFLLSTAPAQDVEFVKGPLTTTIANWTVAQHDYTCYSKGTYKQITSLLADCWKGVFPSQESTTAHSPIEHSHLHQKGYEESITNTNRRHETIPFTTHVNYQPAMNVQYLNNNDCGKGTSCIPARERVRSVSESTDSVSAINISQHSQTNSFNITAVDEEQNYRNRRPVSLSDSIPESKYRRIGDVAMRATSRPCVVIDQRKIQTPLYPNSSHNNEVCNDDINRDKKFECRNQYGNFIHRNRVNRKDPLDNININVINACYNSSPPSNTSILRSPLPTTADKNGLSGLVSASPVSSSLIGSNAEMRHGKNNTPSRRQSPSSRLVSPRGKPTNARLIHHKGDKCNKNKRDDYKKAFKYSTETFVSATSVSNSLSSKVRQCKPSTNTTCNVSKNTIRCSSPAMVMDIYGNPTSRPITPGRQIIDTTTMKKPPLTPKAFYHSHTSPMPTSIQTQSSSTPQRAHKSSYSSPTLTNHPARDHAIGVVSSTESGNDDIQSHWPSPSSKATFLKMMLGSEYNNWMRNHQNNEYSIQRPQQDSSSHIIEPVIRSPMWVSRLGESLFTSLSKMVLYLPNFAGLIGKKKQEIARMNGTASASAVEGIFEHVMMCHCGLDALVRASLLSLKSSCHKYRGICTVSLMLEYFFNCDDTDVIDQLLLFVDCRQKSLKYSKLEVQKVNICEESYVLDRRYIAFNDVPDAVKSMTSCMGSSKEAGKVKLAVGEWVKEEIQYGGLAFDFKGHVDMIELIRAVVAERMGKWKKTSEINKLEEGPDVIEEPPQHTPPPTSSEGYINTKLRQSLVDVDIISDAISVSLRSQVPYPSHGISHDAEGNRASLTSISSIGNDTIVDIVVSPRTLVSPSTSPTTLRYSSNANDNISVRNLSPVYCGDENIPQSLSNTYEPLPSTATCTNGLSSANIARVNTIPYNSSEISHHCTVTQRRHNDSNPLVENPSSGTEMSHPTYYSEPSNAYRNVDSQRTSSIPFSVDSSRNIYTSNEDSNALRKLQGNTKILSVNGVVGVNGNKETFNKHLTNRPDRQFVEHMDTTQKEKMTTILNAFENNPALMDLLHSIVQNKETQSVPPNATSETTSLKEKEAVHSAEPSKADITRGGNVSTDHCVTQGRDNRIGVRDAVTGHTQGVTDSAVPSTLETIAADTYTCGMRPYDHNDTLTAA